MKQIHNQLSSSHPASLAVPSATSGNLLTAALTVTAIIQVALTAAARSFPAALSPADLPLLR